MPDFNDIHLQLGATAVANAINSAKPAGLNIQEDHLSLARFIIDQIGRNNLITTNSHTWMWRNTGLWRPVVDREIKLHVQRNLERIAKKVTRSLVDAVTDIIKTEVFEPNHQWGARTDIINVANGELHFDGEKFVLYPHKRESYCLTQIPVTYDPTVIAPRFFQFLLEIFGTDTDLYEKQLALLEMIGYSLCSHTRFERFAILIGRGANGKSVVLELIRVLLGSENVSSVQPSQFNNRFQRAHLHLKLANIVTEVAEGAEIADAEIKAIVSGEAMTAEEKHKTPFDFLPFCTIWIGTNHMPHTRDFSDALFRRALILQFNSTFIAGVNADPMLKDKLKDELPGILNMAINAYAGVLRKLSFTEPSSSSAAKIEWRHQADQISQFVDEICICSPEGRIPTSMLYNSYNTWASANGIGKRLNHKNFTLRLERLGFVRVRGAGGSREIAGIKSASFPKILNL